MNGKLHNSFYTVHQIMELIKKLKEMNTFLNEMVTYWDKEAGRQYTGN